MSALPLDALEVGQVVAERDFRISRESLVKYAGASGDFNPIHYRDDIAKDVGLPGVLAHGMLTMGIAVQCVVDWIGTDGRILEYGVRFTRPVIVDRIDGAPIAVSARVGAIDSETREVRVDLTVSTNGTTVLGKAQVRVSFS